jgi:hypothetical protein
MRVTSISLALLLAAPVLAGAQERTRPPPPSNPSTPSARADQPDPALAAPSRPDRPPPSYAAPTRPPPPGSVRPPPTGPGSGPWGPPPVYYPSPYWWGYGWGYGYEPLYPLYPSYRDYPEPWPTYGAERAHPAHRVATTMRVTGAAGSGDSGAVGLAFAMDSSRGGFDLAIDAFAPSHGGVMAGGLNDSQDAYGFGSAHFAFPILEGPAYRLRLLAGGSWLSVPSSAYGSPTDAFGPDVGVSASLGLVGPLGIEGHARITPFPVQVFDLRAAVALRTGPFSLLGGYRVIDVAGDSRTGPAARFEGPELGVGLIF